MAGPVTNKGTILIYTGLFTRIDEFYFHDALKLEDTLYMLFINPSGRTSWWRWTNFESKSVSFEEVFNSVDNETRKQLAFHLDLFK